MDVVVFVEEVARHKHDVSSLLEKDWSEELSSRIFLAVGIQLFCPRKKVPTDLLWCFIHGMYCKRIEAWVKKHKMAIVQ